MLLGVENKDTTTAEETTGSEENNEATSVQSPSQKGKKVASSAGMLCLFSHHIHSYFFSI